MYIFCRYKPHTEKKYIIFESCLLKLFAVCMMCGQSAARGFVSNVIGTMVVVTQVCELCGESTHWAGQPFIGETPAGNLLLSAAILFSGSTPTKTLRTLQFMKVQVYQRGTFFRHQRLYLHQAIRVVWKNHQGIIFRGIKPEGMTLGGDARCDSMGHSAKYGSYSAVDLDQKKVVDVELVQVRITIFYGVHY